MLFSVSLALAPLIYLYVKSITTSSFRFKKIEWLHFLPVILFVIYRIAIYSFDASQTGFNEVQNGILKLSLDEPIVFPLVTVFGFAQMLLYLAFTFQLFYNYRKKINEFFSNTYKLELNWIRNFLLLYSFLFLYDMVQTAIASFFFELNYMQRWWLTLFTGLTIIYVGIKGYFTDTTKLKKLNFSFTPNKISIPDVGQNQDKQISEESIRSLREFMEAEKPYLNPELNLVDLAKQVDMSRAQLSEVINSGFGQNFNDFINKYRIEAFQSMIKAKKHQQLSLLGIAYECGFNSKATFNRVFKKLMNSSPTEFLKAASSY